MSMPVIPICTHPSTSHSINFYHPTRLYILCSLSPRHRNQLRLFISYVLSLFLDRSPMIKLGFWEDFIICFRKVIKCLMELHCMVRGVRGCIHFGSADVLIHLSFRKCNRTDLFTHVVLCMHTQCVTLYTLVHRI